MKNKFYRNRAAHTHTYNHNECKRNERKREEKKNAIRRKCRKIDVTYRRASASKERKKERTSERMSGEIVNKQWQEKDITETTTTTAAALPTTATKATITGKVVHYVGTHNYVGVIDYVLTHYIIRVRALVIKSNGNLCTAVR